MTLDPAKDSSCVLALDWAEPSGSTAYDRSQYGNNGTIYGAIRTKGIYSNAIQLDGIDDFIEIANSPSITINNAITILLWVYWSESTACCLLQKKVIGTTDSSMEYSIIPKFWSSPYNYLTIINGTVISSGYYLEDLINLKEWSLIGIRYVGDAIAGSGNAHVDFVLNDKIISTKPAPASITNSGGTLLIGEHTSYGATSPLNGNCYFNGLIGSIRIYNRALSEKGIRSLYYYGIKKLKKLPY